MSDYHAHTISPCRLNHAQFTHFTAAFLCFGVFSAQAKTVTDITGRQVVVPDNPQRIVVGKAACCIAGAAGAGQPGAAHRRLAGGSGAVRCAKLAALYAEVPQIAAIPIISGNNFRQVNIESLLQLKPDLVILARYAREDGDNDLLVSALNKAGVAVIYVDLRIDLLNNTVPSVRLLGEVLNRQQRAEQFIEFYQQHMAVIRQRLAGYQGPKPKVMLHLHLGRRDTCCTTAAHGNLGDLLTFAGGDNIANASVKGVYGELNPETILSANPTFTSPPAWPPQGSGCPICASGRRSANRTPPTASAG